MATPLEIRDAATHIGAAYHVKGELIRDGLMVHGWCWSPARAGERLSVVLLMDGAEVGAAVAARLRLDLVRDGVCDGYHGFSFQLPAQPFSRLEAREAHTGQAFGRILGDQMADVQSWSMQAESQGRVLADAAAALSRCVPALPAAICLGGDVVKSHQRATCSPLVGLPQMANPALSLVIDAGRDAADALEAVMGLAPLLRAHGAEIVVADDGRSTASSALASIPGLVYCPVANGNAADRLNHAVLAGRGARILLMSLPMYFARSNWQQLNGRSLRSVSVNSVANMLSKARKPDEIVACSHLVCVAADATEDGERSGLLLSVDRDVWRAVGSFDPAFDDGAHLPEGDFVWRAQNAGFRVIALNDGAPAPPPGREAASPRLRFAQRQIGAMDV